MNILKVVRVGDDLAVLYNDWTMAAKAPDGNPFEMTGKAVEVVRRQPDGSWRFVLDDPFAR
jgi:ketosteroid isomerase-like protein